MKSKQNLKLFIILIVFLSLPQGILAQDMPVNQINIKSTENPNTDITDNKPKTETNIDITTEDQNQTNSDNNSGIFEIFNLENYKSNKPDIKPKLDIKDNSQHKKILNLNNLVIKSNNDNSIKLEQSRYGRFKQLVSRVMKKYNLNFTTLLAVLGLFGTFLGLFSTWTIYLLNKKNNDPLIIDKKDSAIKYLEAVDKIKESINTGKINRLNSLLDHILNNSLSPSESDELISLISFYSKCTVAISEIPLIEFHNRYKKHIKQKRIDIFNSFIALYKMIEVDGKFYQGTDGIFDYEYLKEINFFTEDSAGRWKHKIITLLSIEEKANTIKKLIIKDLKK